MTARPFSTATGGPPEVDPDATFPEFPPRDDMQNPIYLSDPAHQPALRRHFGSADATIVLGETPVGWRPSQRQGLLIPDLLISFNINRAGVIARKGYSIEEQGKPPDFVLEVASPTTGRNDYTTKREGYANYGVLEYWRFDPTGGQLYPAGLAGDRLVSNAGEGQGGAYVPIAINRVDSDRFWGRSVALGLDLCWEHSQLRWYDPASQHYLRTYDDSEEDRIAETARADAARARVRELEEQLRRLQEP
jgi:hypothetical protein